MAQVERTLIFKLGNEKFMRTYKDNKRKRNYSPDDCSNKTKRSKISNKEISEQIRDLQETVKSVKSDIESIQNKNQINVLVLQGSQDENFYLPKSNCGQLESLKNAKDMIPIKIDAEVIEILSSDEENEKNISSFLKTPQTETCILDNKTKVKTIIKDIKFLPDSSKSHLLMSEERMKLEKKRKLLEQEPCCSKDILKFDEDLKKLNSAEKLNYNLNLIKEEKIPGLEISENFRQELKCDMSDINPHIKKLNHSLKSKRAFNRMMNLKGLVSLFKCMAVKCDYTTMSEDNFIEHLNIHVNSQYFAVDFFLNCSYCCFIAKNPTDLRNHLKTYHINCKFQCNRCFYRSAEARSVFDHQQLHHSGTKSSNKILECPTLLNETNTFENINRRFQQLFKNNLICAVCKEEFIMIDQFLSHLEAHKGGDIQWEMIADQQALMVRKDVTNNRLGKYQCFECDSEAKTGCYGTNIIKEMRLHMQNHPRRFHYVAMRDSESKSIKLTKIRPGLTVIPIKFTDPISSLYNKEKIHKILLD